MAEDEDDIEDDETEDDDEEDAPGIEDERARFFRLLAILASDETTDEQRLRIYELAEQIAAENAKLDNLDSPDTPEDDEGES